MTPLTNLAIEDWMKDVFPKPDPLPPIVIEAVVKFNDGEAFVFSRNPEFKYEFNGPNLIARDGPFVSCFRYEKPQGRFKAFAGRKFNIPMLDGSVTKADGQYWDASPTGLCHVTYSTKKSLLNCYVFTGCSGDVEAITKLREEYSGDVYPYVAYEAVIKAPDLRVAAWNAECKFNRAKKHIIANLRSIKSERDELLNFVQGAQA